MDERGRKRGGTTLVYDSACPACSAAVAWMRDNAQKDELEMLPCQSEELGSRFPDIRREDCMQAMQLVLSDGTVLSGDRALPAVVARLSRFRSAEALFQVPGFQLLARVLYRWFAEHRYGIAHLLRHLRGTDDVRPAQPPAGDRPWQRKTS